jgi:hypothetical protein
VSSTFFEAKQSTNNIDDNANRERNLIAVPTTTKDDEDMIMELDNDDAADYDFLVVKKAKVGDNSRCWKNSQMHQTAEAAVQQQHAQLMQKVCF